MRICSVSLGQGSAMEMFSHACKTDSDSGRPTRRMGSLEGPVCISSISDSGLDTPFDEQVTRDLLKQRRPRKVMDIQLGLGCHCLGLWEQMYQRDNNDQDRSKSEYCEEH